MPASLSSEAEDAIQRLLQEAFTNSLRHGNSRTIEVVFGLTDEEFIISVRDDGECSGSSIEGIGLVGMRERVQSFGGKLTAIASISGYTINARFPLMAIRAEQRMLQ
jgi:signal transduction histidine kinase